MEKKRPRFHYRTLTKRQKAIVLPVMVIICAVAVGLAVWTAVAPPSKDSDNERGVGADGFTAYVEKGTSLGVGSVATRANVAAALGSKAKSVSNADVSSVFNYDGDRGQTLTYNFVRKDNVQASLYIDMTVFQNAQAMSGEDIFADTAPAKVINGHQSYYMHAQTLGAVREYRLLVVNGLKAYKFVIDQPLGDVTLSEVSSLAALVTLAQKAKL